MIDGKINVPDEQWLAQFCESNHIHKLSAFGSVLRDDFHSESDLDLLVEYDPTASIGYLKMMRMQIALTDKIGRQVDLRTPAELSKYFRQRVLDEAEILYVHR
jgi:uncharacterized protein